jgi:hypothetical protein
LSHGNAPFVTLFDLGFGCTVNSGAISVIAILLAEVLETYSGYRGILVVHVPLAMGIFGGIMRQLFWAVRGARSANETLQEG